MGRLHPEIELPRLRLHLHVSASADDVRQQITMTISTVYLLSLQINRVFKSHTSDFLSFGPILPPRHIHVLKPSFSFFFLMRINFISCYAVLKYFGLGTDGLRTSNRRSGL